MISKSTSYLDFSFFEAVRRARENAGGGAYNYPAVIKNNPQGGSIAFPVFGPVVDKLMKAKSKRECSAPAKRGPIAEAADMLLGRKKSVKQKQADSSTVNTSNLVKSREADFKLVGHKFRETLTAQTAHGNKFRVVLLEEGLGNFGDAYYYTATALESAVEIFNGLKIMADHPSSDEEEIRPERSTRDILGHYENLKVEEAEDGQHQLVGDLCTLPGTSFDWARSIMIRAVDNATKFPGKPFIGLSINASGDATEMSVDDVMREAPEGARAKLEEAKENGIDSVRVVNRITRAKSCDLVTEAGAGGKISTILEGE